MCETFFDAWAVESDDINVTISHVGEVKAVIPVQVAFRMFSNLKRQHDQAKKPLAFEAAVLDAG